MYKSVDVVNKCIKLTLVRITFYCVSLECSIYLSSKLILTVELLSLLILFHIRYLMLYVEKSTGHGKEKKS